MIPVLFFKINSQMYRAVRGTQIHIQRKRWDLHERFRRRTGHFLPGKRGAASFGDDRAIQDAIRKIKNCPDFFASECIDLIRKAADWSISFAAGSDAGKNAFLKDISQGKDKEFLRDVLDAYL